jgi:hypothetical protein
VGFASLVVALSMALPLYAFRGLGPGGRPAGAASGAGHGALLVAQLAILPLYIEGSIGHLRVETVNGRLIQEQVIEFDTEPFLRVSLPPGPYQVVSFQQPCDGNCGSLDAPTARCEARVDVSPAATVVAVSEVRSTGCEFHVTDGASVPDTLRVECSARMISGHGDLVALRAGRAHFVIGNDSTVDVRFDVASLADEPRRIQEGSTLPPGGSTFAARMPAGPIYMRCGAGQKGPVKLSAAEAMVVELP